MRYDLVIKTANDLRNSGKYLQAEALINKHLKLANSSEDEIVLTAKPQEAIEEIKKIVKLPKETRNSTKSLIRFKRLIKDIVDQAEIAVEDDEIKEELFALANPLISSLNTIIETAINMGRFKIDQADTVNFIKTRVFGNHYFKTDFKKFLDFVTKHIYPHFI